MGARDYKAEEIIEQAAPCTSPEVFEAIERLALDGHHRLAKEVLRLAKRCNELSRARLAEREWPEPEMVACRACKGSGADETGALPCMECNGLKYMPTTPPPAPSVPEVCDWCARAWDMRSSVQKLLEAADILLDDYDGTGHEEIDEARKSVRTMLTATPAPPRSESVVKAEALEQQIAGADLFRRELIASLKVLFHPHIEGVFSVFLSKLERGDSFPELPEHCTEAARHGDYADVPRELVEDR